MKINIFIVIFILILCTVSLTYYRKHILKRYNLESFKNIEKCDTLKSCKKCLNSTNICAWSPSRNGCILHPQNVSGLIIKKMECPEINISINNEELPIADIDIALDSTKQMDSRPALVTATTNLLNNLSNNLVSGVPQFINPQSIMAQQEANATKADAAAEAIEKQAKGQASAVSGASEAQNAYIQHHQYGSTGAPLRKK